MQGTLYTFGLSVWAAAAELAVIELGCSTEIEKKEVNLASGDNFHPDFIALNSNASIPTLCADGEIYTSTSDVIRYLVRVKGAKLASDRTFIEKVHSEECDPNFAVLLARDDEELKLKAKGPRGSFVQNRQNALLKYAAMPEAQSHKAFYDEKIRSNGFVLSLYQDKASEKDKQAFFTRSKDHVEGLYRFILNDLARHLQDSDKASPFLNGTLPGEEDFHISAWLTRIATVSGASTPEEGVPKLEAAMMTELPPSVKSYWAAWVARPSWKEVYQKGLH